MAEVLKRFGKYFLLDQIAQGGMAEIYRARLADAEGAGRLEVIKRIQTGFGANNEFQQMFKAETKVMLGFSHPNIIQLYAYGEEQGMPFIAMEFIDGKNLRQVITKFAEQKKAFPIDHAIYIASQSACGLHYAHSFKDKISGATTSIIHRDVSPQNILISYDGAVKVIDFGIAKASTAGEFTRAGVIKGKPGYLSPEQISGDPLDGRCDIFALGIVLWEMLAGRKLFVGESDLAILKLIESCQTYVKPPSTINPQVPKELDAIVMKALTKQRERRYQTADEFHRALQRLLVSVSPDYSPSDLAHLARDIFQVEIIEDRKRIQRLNGRVEQMISVESAVVSAPDLLPDEPQTGVVAVPTSSKVRAPELPKFERPQSPSSTASPPSSPSNDPFGARASTRNSGPVAPTRSEDSVLLEAPSRSVRTQTKLKNQRPAVPIYEDRGTGRSARKSGGGLFASLTVLFVLFSGALVGAHFLGYPVPGVSGWIESVQQLASQNSNKDAGKEAGLESPDPTLAQVDSSPEPVPPPPDRNPASVNPPASEKAYTADHLLKNQALLRLKVNPPGLNGQTLLNGKTIDLVSNPLPTVSVGAPLEIVVERSGFKTLKRQFSVDAAKLNSNREYTLEIELEALRFGELNLSSTPSAEVSTTVDGKTWIRRTPFEKEKLPVGTYRLRLVNEVLGMEKTISITIQDGKSITRSERLEVRN